MYVSRVCVRLDGELSSVPKNIWKTEIKTEKYECRWRYKKNDDFEMISGPFESIEEALQESKRMYISVLYGFWLSQMWIKDIGSYYINMHVTETEEEKNDTSEFRYHLIKKNRRESKPGMGVYEIDGSLDDFDKLSDNSISGIFIKAIHPEYKMPMDKIMLKYYSCDERIYEILSSISLADHSSDNIEIIILWSVLENLADDTGKSKEEIELFDRLIQHVEDYDISQDKKVDAINYLRAGKRISSRKKCKRLVEKYCHRTYNGMSGWDICEEAYKVRSAYSHGNGKSEHRKAFIIKYVILEILLNMMKEKESSQ